MLQFFSSWQHAPKVIYLNVIQQRCTARIAPKKLTIR
jgi:hypothetical protein